MNRRWPHPSLRAPRRSRRPAILSALVLCLGVAGCFSPDDHDGKDDTAGEGSVDPDADGDGWTVGEGDCDDNDATVYPGADEYCNGKDNDCNGVVDDDHALDAATWYRDADGDGYGDPFTTTTACERPEGYVDNGDDCDDTDASVNPRATEAGADEDCDGSIDLSFAAARFTGETSGDYAGYAVSGAGDVNGDGFDDILVGSRYEGSGGVYAGAAYLVLGPVSGTLSLSNADAKLTGEASGDYAGYTVSGAGDVNGDGFADILVGALGQDSGGSQAGVAYLVYGPVSGTLSLSNADAKLIGEASGDYAGTSVSAAGDVNGDGFDDILVGARYEGSGGRYAGAAYLVYGPVNGGLDLADADAKLIGEASFHNAGYAVSGAGDVNGDGFDDILVGAPGEDSGGSIAGAAYLVYGPVHGEVDLADADAKLIGEASGDSAGCAVSSAGDVNGDGYDDLMVGAYWESSGDELAGAAYLVYGPVNGGLDLADADAKLIGEASDDYAGASVSGAGDVNGDGFDDILVGARSNDWNTGTAYLVLGPVSGTVDLGAADVKLIGEAPYDYAGWSVSGAGDVNGDGFDDILVGAPDENSGGSNAGAAYLVLGWSR